MSPCIPGETSMRVLGEPGGLSRSWQTAVPSAWCPIAPVCLMAPCKCPNTLVSTLPMNQLGAPTGIFSAYSENFLASCPGKVPSAFVVSGILR